MTSPLRVVLVGCGYIAQAEHVPALLSLQPEIQVVGAVDVNDSRAQGVAALFQAPAFSTLREALEKVDFEAVIICTPAPSHPALIIESAQAGKAILVEKPVAYNLQEARDTTSAVERSGAKCMVAYHRRYDDDCLHVKKLITDGAIGKVRAAVSLCRLVFRPHFRPYTVLSSHEAQTGPQDLPADWLTENSIHHINLLRFWLGDIVGIHSALYGDRDHNLGIITLEFQDHVLASHHQLRGMDCGEEITVYGTGGNLRVELWYPHRPYRFPKLTLFTVEPPRWQEIAITRSSPYTNEVAQFHKYVRGEGEMWSSLDDSCRDLEILKEVLDKAVYVESNSPEAKE